MKQEASVNPPETERTIRPVSYVLLFLMMVCFIMTVDILLKSALPSWPAGIISGIILFIVLDRLYTYQNFKSIIPLTPEWARSFGAQWVVIVLFIRLLLSYANGPDAFMADMSLFLRGYLNAFFTTQFVVTLLFAIMAWFLLGQFLNLLDEIGIEQARALREGPTTLPNDTLPAHQRLINLVFGTGIALVILAALTRVDFEMIFGDRYHLPIEKLSGGEVGALLYFIIGLALVSHSRLMSLQTRWGQQRIPVSSDNLSKRWGAYSFLFLLLLTLFVGILPAGDSLGLFSLLSTLLGFLLGILFVFAQWAFFLINLLVSLPFLFLKQPPPFEMEIVPTPTPTPEIFPPSEPAVENALLLLAKSLILWGALAAIITISLIVYVRQHGGLVATIRRTKFFSWLVLAWQWLRSNADSARKTLSDAIAGGWQNIRSRIESRRLSPRSSWFSLRSLDPRRQVYFFYLAMIRRGDEQGLSRKPSQTPAEYSASLENALPAVEEDIDLMTDAFIKARYSRENVDSGKVNLVKSAWGHVRRALSVQFKKK